LIIIFIIIKNKIKKKWSTSHQRHQTELCVSSPPRTGKIKIEGNGVGLLVLGTGEGAELLRLGIAQSPLNEMKPVLSPEMLPIHEEEGNPGGSTIHS